MLDRVIALVALSALLLFMAIIIMWVPEPALIVIVTGCMAMACFDFYRMLVLEPRRKQAERAAMVPPVPERLS